jgi:hypothetical protein
MVGFISKELGGMFTRLHLRLTYIVFIAECKYCTCDIVKGLHKGTKFAMQCLIFKEKKTAKSLLNGDLLHMPHEG